MLAEGPVNSKLSVINRFLAQPNERDIFYIERYYFQKRQAEVSYYFVKKLEFFFYSIILKWPTWPKYLIPY